MQKAHSEFRGLLARAQCDDLAVVELLEEYGPQVCRSVRHQMSRLMRSRFDTHDFAQAVWASFFANRELITRFQSPAELVAFLSRVAQNKVIDEFRRHFTQKMNVNREHAIDDDSNSALKQELSAHGPSPSEFAIANEVWAEMVRGQPSNHRRILELRAVGCTHKEISGALGINERTVRRFVKRIARQLRHG